MLTFYSLQCMTSFSRTRTGTRPFPGTMGLEGIFREMKKYRKVIFKAMLYFILLILFVRFYLIDEISNFAKGSTTISSRTKRVDFLEAPYITFCFQQPFKPSVIQEYGLTNNEELNFYDITNASKRFSSWELFQKFAYMNEKDFNITIESKIEWERPKDIKFEIQGVATLRHGLCYLMKYKANVSTANERIRVYFRFTGLKEDVPKSVKLYLSSPNNWHGIIVDDWPLIHPQMFEVPIRQQSKSRWIAKMSQTDFHYLYGTQGFETCFMEKINTHYYSYCPTKCFPSLFNFLPNLPPCNTSEEFNCMLDLVLGSRKMRYECLHPKDDIQYKADFYPAYKTHSSGSDFFFMFYFDRGTKDIKEEILIVTAGNFIGSVGGSLGLFLGFSFFSYMSGIFDKILP